jgi:hypothetical protein
LIEPNANFFNNVFKWGGRKMWRRKTRPLCGVIPRRFAARSRQLSAHPLAAFEIPWSNLGVLGSRLKHWHALTGATEQVTLIRWHPVASNLLLSVSFDNTARVWDVNKVRTLAAAPTATCKRRVMEEESTLLT